MNPEQTRLGLLLNRFTRRTHIRRPFELFNEAVRLFPYWSDIEVLETLEICKLQAGAQHGFGIDWEIFRHCFYPNASPNSTRLRTPIPDGPLGKYGLSSSFQAVPAMSR